MKDSRVYQTKNITENDYKAYIDEISSASFSKIAPFWPLKNLIAVNPLQGLEELPIEEALKISEAYFEQKNLPQEMESINRETIKWMQAYFDEGQATISMPIREQGLYSAWKKLALYDEKIHGNNKEKKQFIKDLTEEPERVIMECLRSLNIKKEEHVEFLTILLTTLPGWASYIKYRTEWSGLEKNHPYSVYQNEYLAIRIIISFLLWPESKDLINWHKKNLEKSEYGKKLEKIKEEESSYRLSLLEKLASQPISNANNPEAQLIFCIDVRSEPFRRALESTGNYQTFGFAGFFGIPVQIMDSVTNETYASCPVLLSPKHKVEESPCSHQAWMKDHKGYLRLSLLKRLYQSVKYNFTTPFGLVESIGILSGILMGIRTLTPNFAFKLKKTIIQNIRKPQEVEPSLDDISFTDKCTYAEGMLKMIGLTNHFAPIIVLCGHGSSTQNNAYATALDCGACGGRHGASNARILARILNLPEVRSNLGEKGINIPQTTCFIAAEHNTTTDEVTIYGNHNTVEIRKLKESLEKTRNINSLIRLQKMEEKVKPSTAASDTWIRSQDWSQVRPEWGLARNAAFIVAPRDITYSLNLEGRCFLHSYDYKQDMEGCSLTTILTAPMVVAEWINTQYLFSTLNNVAYGGGSKITKNITGKIGIMQGNASDLMNGLPLQSVFNSDIEAYHNPQRLMTVVFSPRQMIEKIINEQSILKKLFGNGWVQMACIEPDNRCIYLLNRDFTWKKMN